MDTVQHQPRTASVLPGSAGRSPATLPPWRLNVMRVGYLVMGVGLAVTKWPELVHHDPWELMRGTVVTMLVTMSVRCSALRTNRAASTASVPMIP